MAAAGARAATGRLGRLGQLTLLSLVAACSAMSLDLIEPAEPKQKGMGNSMQARGARGFDQRQRDCWDMPSAQACYEVGLNYELGLAGKANRTTALQYYDKACRLDRQPEHCEAAERLRRDE